MDFNLDAEISIKQSHMKFYHQLSCVTKAVVGMSAKTVISANVLINVLSDAPLLIPG